jgi:hypothetical protein
LLLAEQEVGAALAGGAGAKKALEDGARIRFRRHRRRRRTPGHIALISARVAGVAIARLANDVGSDLQGRETRQAADLIGGDLVDGDAGADVGPLGFADAHAGEESPSGAAMVAGAVGAGRSVLVIQPADDLNLALDRFQWPKGAVQFEVASGLPGRPPILRQSAIGEFHERHTDGRPQRGSGGLRSQQRPNRFQRRQGHAHAQTTQQLSPAQEQLTLIGLHHGLGSSRA